MSPTPPADVEITADLVGALLREQHPDLAGRPLRPSAQGWDNAVVRLGDDLAVRLPRRAAAVPLLRAEQEWLPELAPRLPLPVPTPVRVGVPGHGYPYPWSVVTWVPGVPAVHVDGDIAPLDGAATAASLAAFLAALHRPAPRAAPRSRFRGVPLADRAHGDDVLARRLADRDDEVSLLAPELAGVLARARCAPAWPGPPLWLHGDLHPANVLLARGCPSGVVDFGDLCAGDPATDLAVAWMLVPATDRAVFWATYPALPADPFLQVRARGWAATFALLFLALADDTAGLAAVGAATARAVIDG